jgi:hypothetical protein
VTPRHLPSPPEIPTCWPGTELEGRILITRDRATIPDHLRAHLDAGRHSPGIFAVRRAASIAAVLEYLVLAAYASASEEWRDQIQYIP